jgi:hypothetical protein
MARGPNQKAVAAAEKKAANQAVKDAEKSRQNEARSVSVGFVTSNDPKLNCIFEKL